MLNTPVAANSPRFKGYIVNHDSFFKFSNFTRDKVRKVIKTRKNDIQAASEGLRFSIKGRKPSTLTIFGLPKRESFFKDLYFMMKVAKDRILYGNKVPYIQKIVNTSKLSHDELGDVLVRAAEKTREGVFESFGNTSEKI